MTRRRFDKRLIWLIAAIAAAILFYLYIRPLPPVRPQSQLPAAPKTAVVQLPWPTGGQAALGADGYGVLASHGDLSPVPIGSTAKVITALAVLQKNPLPAGGQGPTITLDSSDAALFDTYYTQGGSVTKVTAGEQITELQALQSLLLPSSNNMADSLANWAFGSVDAYVAYANTMAKNMGLSHTHVGDSNGFSDTTTSTADDLVKLGLAALKNPALAGVVSQSSAVVPVSGAISNTNFLLGQDGIVGIKTGNTEKAGGCYIFAAQQTILSKKITLVGAVLSQPTLTDAVRSAPPLLQAAGSGFSKIALVRAGQTLGSYKAPWGSTANYKSVNDLSLLAWKGAATTTTAKINQTGPAQAGTAVGKVTVTNSGESLSSNVVLSSDLSGPSPLWRFIR